MWGKRHKYSGRQRKCRVYLTCIIRPRRSSAAFSMSFDSCVYLYAPKKISSRLNDAILMNSCFCGGGALSIKITLLTEESCQKHGLGDQLLPGYYSSDQAAIFSKLRWKTHKARKKRIRALSLRGPEIYVFYFRNIFSDGHCMLYTNK